jgi:hypothetical protein
MFTHTILSRGVRQAEDHEYYGNELKYSEHIIGHDPQTKPSLNFTLIDGGEYKSDISVILLNITDDLALKMKEYSAILDGISEVDASRALNSSSTPRPSRSIGTFLKFPFVTIMRYFMSSGVDPTNHTITITAELSHKESKYR